MKFPVHSLIIIPAFVILVTIIGPGHKVKATSITERLLKEASQGLLFDDRDLERSDTILGKLQVLIGLMREIKSGTIDTGALAQQTTTSPSTPLIDDDDDDDDNDKGRHSGTSNKAETEGSRLLTLLARDRCYAEYLKNGTDPVLLTHLCNILEMAKRTVVQTGGSG